MDRKQQKALKIVLWILALCLAGYIVAPPLFWQLSESFNATLRYAASSSSPYSSSCPPCRCDCSSQPLLSLPEGSSDNSIIDCMKQDPLVSEDMEKSFIDLLTEEVRLKEAEALEKHQRADVALLEAKKFASQYQKEADKCNSGMDTCEEAREKAEATLAEQIKMTAVWEFRAREKGWEESRMRFRYV